MQYQTSLPSSLPLQLLGEHIFTPTESRAGVEVVMNSLSVPQTAVKLPNRKDDIQHRPLCHNFSMIVLLYFTYFKVKLPFPIVSSATTFSTVVPWQTKN